MSRIYLSAPDVRGREEQYVLEAIRSNWVAPLGPALDQFEREIAARCGVSFAVGLSSGTAALHLALVTAGIGPGDIVLVPTLTFVPTANVVRYVGAEPVFIDVDETSWNLSAPLLAEELDATAKKGARVSAVMAVDLYGQCADYDAIVPLAASHGALLVEDAAEALGATRSGNRAGSFGDVAALSFNGNKIITTSGGGMLLTDRHEVAEHARKLATQAREPAPHYEHAEIGYNYRLSNLLAAFGRAQLETLEDRIKRRTSIREAYRSLLDRYDGVDMMPTAVGSAPNAWLTCIVVDPGRAGTSAEALRVHLEDHNVESRPIWKPMHRQPLFAGARARLDGTADKIFDQGLCLPSGSGMTDAELEEVLSLIDKHLERATTSKAGRT